MNRLLPKLKHGECGSVAVEFAVLLPTVLVPLLAGALFFGRFFWHYTVAEKAAHDAARFVAAASPTEMKTQCTLLIYKDPCVVMAAMSLATVEMAELNPGGSDSPSVTVYCDDKKCATNKGSAAPKMITVDVVMTVEDPFLSVYTEFFTGGKGPIAIPIDATARTSYVGN